ncbi:thiosulfate oxidation carrier protein SoxY [Defluviimonas salinarum]|uniref:Thiosulfate oxidation carrier protein SoxY n=1 Tax=Defluviimonas salinarum TaxID=2992147 RepID=A0ABT3J3T5_9RHOB|nr:thiosulfate oxidation carrier protein SoxY [Defluviimonas salinarum]MCW3782344.1 thiosulfate oxidation carrier protein SoxY [Defluviimonas salinarum]
MQLSRRNAMAIGLGGVALAILPRQVRAATVEELTAAFAGGAAVGTGGLTLTAPEIAENGNTVPISVSAPGAAAIMLIATGNPTPAVGTFNFGPAAGSQAVSTRIRLAKTQDVIAMAKMADGSVVQAQATVKVTIGGCGG